MRPNLPVLFLGAGLLLGGCGFKGDLYIPQVPAAQPASAPAPAQTPAPDDTKADTANPT